MRERGRNAAGPSYDMNDAEPPPRDWHSLDEAEQTALREAFGHYLDQLPPTCSLRAKIARFRHWLAAQGIDYRDDA